MIFLILSIACSVTVGVLLKFAKRYQINVMQAVTWNYLFAIVLSFIIFKPAISDITLAHIHPTYLALGILLPTIFVVQARAVFHAGLAKTDIAQRLSLFISLCAAYFLFNEQFDGYKRIGLVFGFAAIVLTLMRKKDVAQESTGKSVIYLLFVFLGFGCIDVFFKMVSQITAISYTTSLVIIFGIAFILSLIYLSYLTVTKRIKLQLINLICGCILGLFNFGNILFYIKAHKAMAESPFVVFASMNIGVIVLGSLIGVLIFKEKLSKLNYLGLLFALIAIILITLSKIYAV